MNSRPLHRQAGIGLVEIMIALAIALFLLAGIYALFVNTKSTYTTQQGLSRLQETARYTLNRLAREVRMAGYRGCGGVGTAAIDNRLAVSSTNAAQQFIYDFKLAVEGNDAQGGGTWAPSLPPTLTGLTHPPLADSDVLTIRGGTGQSVNITAPMPKTSSELKVNNVSTSGLKAGDIVMLSDCSHASIFQVTAIQTSSNHIQHHGGTDAANDPPGNISQTLSYVYQAGAGVQQYGTTSYYIADADATSTSETVAGCKDGGCGLWMKTGNDAPVELVRGVDDMQVLYGVAPDLKEAASSYVTADNVSDWTRVVSVRLALLVSSISPALQQVDTSSYDLLGASVTPNDRRLHRVFVTTIAIRNHLP